MSIRRKSARKMRVKIARPTENASPAIPRIEEIACGTESARFVAPCWTFSARSRVARPGKLVGVPQLVDDLRKALHEVPQRTDERDEQEEGEDCDDDCRAEHDDCRRNAASPSRPPDEGAQRDLEDESEEDPEEDEDQRVADRDDGRREQGDGRGEKQRAEGNGARRGARVVHLRAPRLRSPPRPILTGRSARVTACRPGPDGGP